MLNILDTKICTDCGTNFQNSRRKRCAPCQKIYIEKWDKLNGIDSRCSSCHNPYQDWETPTGTCFRCTNRNKGKAMIKFSKPLKMKLDDDSTIEKKKILLDKPIIRQKKERSESHSDAIALSLSGAKTNLTATQFKEIRNLIGKQSKVSIGKKYGCSRDLVRKIELGYLHTDEVFELTSNELKEYKMNYIQKQRLTKVKNKSSNLSGGQKAALTKRKIKDIGIILKIFLHKFMIDPDTNKAYNSAKVNDIFSRIEGSESITVNIILNIWRGKMKLHESEFNDTIVSYERYKELITLPRKKEFVNNLELIPELEYLIN